MGLRKTSNFSIFTFTKANDLKFCTCSYSSCVYRMMMFKGLNGKVCKMITSHFRTLLLKLTSFKEIFKKLVPCRIQLPIHWDGVVSQDLWDLR